MFVKKILFLCHFFFTLLLVAQQNQVTISGTIKDASTGETLPGASIIVKNEPKIGTQANYYGFYSLRVPQGTQIFVCSYLGYKDVEITVSCSQNITQNIDLQPQAENLEEVVLQSTTARKHIRSTDMSVSKVSVKEIETVPVLFGEKDIIKTLQLLPGVKSAGEGSSGFFVRGGSADQNLILLDEAPVYNASHLLGFFSVFNSDALKDVQLYKGYFPSKYGGRLSSVLDIQMKDGNAKTFSGSGGIGLISSKLTIEAPIVKDKGSFIVSGRRTYADFFLKLSSDEDLKNNTLYFYDFNIKGNYTINNKNKIYLSGYFGRDVLGFGNEFGFDWGNSTGTLRYNHLFNEKLFSNTSLIYSDFDYNINIGSEDEAIIIAAKIKDWNLKQDFNYYFNENNKMELGLNTIYHQFMPGEINSTMPSINQSQLETKYALESALYVNNNQKISDNLSVSYGLRFSKFTQFGPGNIFSYNTYGEKISEQFYDKNEVVASYNGWEPRASVNYVLNNKNSIKAAYTKTYQYLHLISNSNGDNPTDVWLPSSNNVKPQSAQQWALGYFTNFGKNEVFQFSVETYYKDFKDAVDFRTGAELTLNPAVEGELLFGKGRAYGIELLVKKSQGKFTGWFGYTLARSEKQFEEINNNTWFPAKQDRTHDISIVGSYTLNSRMIVSANWVYYTGNAVTFPTGRYELDGNFFNYYTERNGGRMPDYHRFDIGLTVKEKNYRLQLDAQTGESVKKPKKFESEWNFSIYNAYARENAYSIRFEPSKADPTKNVAVQTSLFKIVPSVSYHVKF